MLQTRGKTKFRYKCIVAASPHIGKRSLQVFAFGEAEEVLNVRRRRTEIDIHAHCASRIVVAALAAVDAASPNYRIALVDILVLRTKNPLCFGFAAKVGPFRGTGNSVL